MKYKNFWNKIKSFDRDRKIINSRFSLTENLTNLSEYIEENYKINNSLRFYIKHCLAIIALVFLWFLFGKIVPDDWKGILFGFWVIIGIVSLGYIPFPGDQYTKKVFQLVKKNPKQIVEVVQKNIDNTKMQLSQLKKRQHTLHKIIDSYDEQKAVEYVLNHYYDRVPYFDLIKDGGFSTILRAEVTNDIAALDTEIEYIGGVKTIFEKQKTFFETL